MVLATNQIDKRHFSTVQNTLTTVHKDRVVAQDCVYKMNNVIHRKQIELINNDSKITNSDMNNEFQTLIDISATTKLTKNESNVFKSLKENFDKFKMEEQNCDNKQLLSNDGLIKNIESLQTDLNNLALIQVSESKYLTDLAQKSLNSNKLMSQLEIGFIIVIGLLLQFIMFYRVKKSKPSDNTDSLKPAN